VVVDFDGTLAPIVDDPAAARPLPETRDVLGRLVGRLGRVAVVSGRPAAFLARALPAPGLVLVGQYGLERWQDGRGVADPRALSYAEAVASAAADAEASLPALVVERKGVIAVTLHWRVVPALEDEAFALGLRLADRYGLALQPGRLALELRPPLPVDKGTATEELADGFHAALMAGDDHGDVAAFAALDRLVAGGRLAYGLRIGVRSSEAPPSLLEASDYQVDGPGGVVTLLARLEAGLA
jgi:trehalose 6-phosphate phosphatase